MPADNSSSNNKDTNGTYSVDISPVTATYATRDLHTMLTYTQAFATTHNQRDRQARLSIDVEDGLARPSSDSMLVDALFVPRGGIYSRAYVRRTTHR